MGVLLLSHSWNPLICWLNVPWNSTFFAQIFACVEAFLLISLSTFLLSLTGKFYLSALEEGEKNLSITVEGIRDKKSYFHEQKWIPSWLICLSSIANLLTYNQHQRRYSWILYYRVSFSGVFSNTVQSHYYTLIAGLLLCYLPLFGYHRRCCCCVPHGLEHRWKQIVLEREALRPCISNSHLVVALRAAMPGM